MICCNLQSVLSPGQFSVLSLLLSFVFLKCGIKFVCTSWKLKDLTVLCGVLFSRWVHGTQEFRGKSSFRGSEGYGPAERLVRNSATQLSGLIKLAKTANM